MSVPARRGRRVGLRERRTCGERPVPPGDVRDDHVQPRAVRERRVDKRSAQIDSAARALEHLHGQVAHLVGDEHRGGQLAAAVRASPVGGNPRQPTCSHEHVTAPGLRSRPPPHRLISAHPRNKIISVTLLAFGAGRLPSSRRWRCTSPAGRRMGSDVSVATLEVGAAGRESRRMTCATLPRGTCRQPGQARR